MTEKSKNQNSVIQKAAILSLSLLILGPQALSSAMGQLIAAFPNVPQSQIRLLVSLPLITLIVFTLLTNILDKKVDKKITVCIGISCFTVFGVLCTFTSSFSAIVVLRLLMGIGLGLTAPYAISFISLLYSGKERAQMIGLNSAFTNVGSLVLMALAGALAAASWHYTFLMYLIGIPVLLLVILFVPSFPPVKEEKKKKVQEKKEQLSRKVWMDAVGTFLFFIAFFIVFSDFAMLISSRGLGDATQTSIALTFLSASALIVSCLYQRLSSALKRLHVPFGIFLAAIGFMVMGFANSFAMAVVGTIFAGAAFGVIMPHCYNYAAVNTSQGPLQARAAVVVTIATNLASFLSAYILNAILAIINRDVGENIIFRTVGILFIIGMVAELIICLHRKEAKD